MVMNAIDLGQARSGPSRWPSRRPTSRFTSAITTSSWSIGAGCPTRGSAAAVRARRSPGCGSRSTCRWPRSSPRSWTSRGCCSPTRGWSRGRRRARDSRAAGAQPCRLPRARQAPRAAHGARDRDGAAGAAGRPRPVRAGPRGVRRRRLCRGEPVEPEIRIRAALASAAYHAARGAVDAARGLRRRMR